MQALSIICLALFALFVSGIPHLNPTSVGLSDSPNRRKLVWNKSSATVSVNSSRETEKGWTDPTWKSTSSVDANLISKDMEGEKLTHSVRQSQPDCDTGKGLSGSRCSSSQECKGERTCQENVLGATRCAFSDSSFVRCGAGIPCQESGERCLQNQALDLTLCLSEEFAIEMGVRPPMSPDECPDISEPCIAVDALRNLSRENLVFEKDILSHVLCDRNLSCATAGHMVAYRGKGMMMKSYCKVVGSCIKRVMLVNSPRYRMKFRISSRSDELVFTALSARYVSKAEEQVLSAAIRLGL